MAPLEDRLEKVRAFQMKNFSLKTKLRHLLKPIAASQAQQEKRNTANQKETADGHLQGGPSMFSSTQAGDNTVRSASNSMRMLKNIQVEAVDRDDESDCSIATPPIETSSSAFSQSQCCV